MTLGISLPDVPLYKELQRRLEIRHSGPRAFARVNQCEFLDMYKIPDPRVIDPSVLNTLIMTQYSLAHPNNYIVYGTASFTDMTTHTKYLAQWPFLASEVANEYIKYICEDANWTPINRKHKLEQSGPPGYFMGYSRGTLAYVDIQSCYFQLYSVGGFDCTYGHGELSEPTVFFINSEQFGLHKEVRNICFGLFIHTHSNGLKNGSYRRIKQLSPAYQPDLGSYVFDTITAIAQDCITNFPIKAWITDAAILPNKYAQELIDFLYTEWKIIAVLKVSAPDSILYNIYSHKIGDKITQDIKNGKTPHKGIPIKELPKIVDVQKLKETRKWLTSVPDSYTI